ncbi:hypothetical protein I3F58_06435 [Streptomyces sp. MUM 203J]|uniref:hypothetical protein n=1 Tax=Streptomyces sp. MUM 203J TaxID=2791990 RepID=UPI0027E48293|nr:hypothetical protein [Streptomyces sp. MUM 203J]MCH0539198.1 hypothetical protein [Streptomyces sp. MUM 203J]
MTGFEAIDAFLAGARREIALPPAEERRALREDLGPSRQQMARTLGASTSTASGEGLLDVRATGTGELHVTGDSRRVCAEDAVPPR